MNYLPEKFRTGNDELTQRFEAATARQPLAGLNLEQHEKMFHTVARAASFESLSPEIQSLILQSEAAND